MRIAALIVLFAMTAPGLCAPSPCLAALMPPDPDAYKPREGDFSIDFPQPPDASGRLIRQRTRAGLHGQ